MEPEAQAQRVARAEDPEAQGPVGMESVAEQPETEAPLPGLAAQ